MPMLGGTGRTSEYCWGHEGPNDLIAMTGAQDKMADASAQSVNEQMHESADAALSFTVPRRASRAEMVAQAVEDRIVEQKLDVGTRLGSRTDLGERLGVAPRDAFAEIERREKLYGIAEKLPKAVNAHPRRLSSLASRRKVLP